jgi:beta-carotene ketolase (CrtO type)
VHDFDVIVIGGGHNGLVTAAYLAKAGRKTLICEARESVGGTAASEAFAGATVSICNCDHLTIRTTPVIDELALERFGLRYVDLEPSGTTVAWSDRTNAWTQWHDVERTVDGLRESHPSEVEGYRRYLATSMPAAAAILAAAVDPPTVRSLARVALRRRFTGLRAVFAWSRRSAADVMRDYFRHDALAAGGLVGGPLVWGISPELVGTGLGALGYAMRHVAAVGRPVGGSGVLPMALRAALEHHGGIVRTGARVAAILCDQRAVRAVRLADGTELTAPVVVSAADPRRTFVEWLHNPPAGAGTLVERWRAKRLEDGYESKLDAVITEVPAVRGALHPLSSTMTVAPTIAEMDEAYRHRLSSGSVIERPALLVNVPSLTEPSLAPPGRHVLSIEVLLTPYAHPGGWARSPEPRRWLELFAGLCENDVAGSIESLRAMTPDVYEREFHLPRGHATSFPGGPLALLRNPDPELTGYETHVPGLFITGAATFPGAGIWGASGRNCAAVVLARTP